MSQETGGVTQHKQPLGVATLLLWGGMGIAFLGAVFFVAQYFDDWVEAAELLVALGIGISFTYLGIRAERKSPAQAPPRSGSFSGSRASFRALASSRR